MNKRFISFRLPKQLSERVRLVAQAEMLSVSAICRRSVWQTIQDLEAKHGLGAAKPSISTSNGLPSEWIMGQR